MQETKDVKYDAIDVFVILLLLIPLSLYLNGVVFAQLWAWFVAPAFKLPLLSTAVATGLVGTIRFTVFNMSGKTENRSVPLMFILALVVPGMSYFTGAIIHAFV